MNELEKNCKEQLVILNQLISECKNKLNQAPDGNLQISSQKNIPRYYWKNSTDTSKKTYIKRDNLELVHQLAQKDYLEKFLQMLIKQQTLLSNFHSQFAWSEITNFHKQLSLTRQSLITPMILAENEYIKHWEHLCYKQANHVISLPTYHHYPIDDNTGILTEKGELVRSKSEKIIADKLFIMDIPYIYEMPILLKKSIVLHPDFTVLNKRTRQEYYWEHFGLMNREDYAEQAIKKISTYEDNNIYQGRKLLTTYETYSQPFNTRRLECLIREFLL